MKARNTIIILIAIANFIGAGLQSFAQVSINADSSLAHPSAGLDVKFSDKGVLFPRMTMAERDAIVNPANGLIVICTDCVEGGTLSIFLNGIWRIAPMADCNISPPTAGTHVASSTQIVWNWNAVSGATGYKWSTTNDFSTSIDLGSAMTKLDTGLTCNTSYIRFIWAYNSCEHSNSSTLNQATTECIPPPLPCPGVPTVSYGGKTYNTVQIGNQCWLRENLNIGTKKNALTGENQTNNGIIEKFCFIDDESYCNIYGGLYQWDELMNYTTSSNSSPSGRQGICPSGWHIPSDAEWCQMEYYLDSTSVCDIEGWRGTNLGAKLKESGFDHWISPNNGTNSSGFSALPGGSWDSITNEYYSLHYNGSFYTATSLGQYNNIPIYRLLSFGMTKIWREETLKSTSFSIRCVKDVCDPPSSPTEGTHIPSQNQIIWNWNAVTGASGYKWNVTNDYNTAIDVGPLTTKTETGLACNTIYLRYVWAYSNCGYSAATSMTQTTQTSTNPPGPCPGTETVSYGGIIYNTAQIGCQCWLKENLNIGIKINALSVNNQANNDTIEKFCYNDLESNCDIYGGIYQWHEMMSYTSASDANPSGRQGICPAGWHIPSDPEWCQMITFLDPTANCTTKWVQIGTDAGGKLKETGTTHWLSPNTGATNSSEFTGLPGGIWKTNAYNELQYFGYFWTASEHVFNSQSFYWYYYLHYGAATVGNGDYYDLGGMSVRCVKD
jgi:uncharacterized protein (TIGR02145 family)